MMLSLLSFTAGRDIYWFYNPIPCVIKRLIPDLIPEIEDLIDKRIQRSHSKPGRLGYLKVEWMGA